MARWWAPAALAVVSLGTGALAVWEPQPPAAPGLPDVRAPVLSARRVPALLAQLVADGRLRADLDAALAAPELGPAGQASCLVVRQGSRPVLARRPGAALIPASTLKVLTAVAVLARLQPDERLVTEARAAAPPGSGGVVAGDLWVVGAGDPLLATADYAAAFPNQPAVVTPFERLADALVEAGVRAVTGRVLGDESRFDAVRYLPSWKPSYREDGDVGPASALAVNDGFLSFGPRPVAAERPAAHAAAVLTALLQARGVAVGGGAGEGRAPAGAATVARLPSPPVATIVGQMLRESDNNTAELLVKELGRRFGGGGTTAAGLTVVREALAAAGLPLGPLAAVDGSGLDRSDRVSCDLLLAAFAGAGPDGPVAAGFPVAARDGTLARRFQGHPAAGRLAAKTGSLSGVTGLAGFLEPPGPGPALAFALVANELPRDAAGRRLQEDVAAALARYPDAPPAADLGPAR